MNRSGLITDMRIHLNQVGAGYVTGTTAIALIDGALKRVNRNGEVYRCDMTVSLYDGGQEFAAPTAMMQVYRVRLGTGADRVKLKVTDPGALDRTDDGWEGATSGTPASYYFDGMNFGVVPRQRALDTWAKSTAYAVGDRIKPATDNGLFYSCLVAGTSSAATHPTWPTTIDGTVSETTGVEWEQDGCCHVYIRALKDVPTMGTSTATPSWCPSAFHRTISKAAAIDAAGGFDAGGADSNARLQKLYSDYMQEITDLREVLGERSMENVQTLSPKGYSTYRTS